MSYEQIACLVKLRILNLSDNQISSLEGLSSLKTLEELDVSGNAIEHIPTCIRHNAALRLLRISRNRISNVPLFPHLLYFGITIHHVVVLRCRNYDDCVIFPIF